MYVAQLSLSCGTVDRSLSVTGKLPVMVTLQAVAENPSVEVHIHFVCLFIFFVLLVVIIKFLCWGIITTVAL